jgi:NAD+ kinase
VEPCAHNIIITPICAHILAAKAFVLASERRVTVELGHIKANPAYLTVDGGVYLNLVSGDKVNVHKSEKETWLVHLANRSFYKKVSEKLGE